MATPSSPSLFPDAETRLLANRLAAPIVLITAAPVPNNAVPEVDAVAVDSDEILLGWLRSGRASTVLLRPDRAVLAQSVASDRHLSLADLDPLVAASQVDPLFPREVAGAHSSPSQGALPAPESAVSGVVVPVEQPSEAMPRRLPQTAPSSQTASSRKPFLLPADRYFA